MSDKSDAFKRDIQDVIAKYDGKFDMDETYDQDDYLIGETYYVVVDGQRFDMGDFDPEAL